MPLGRYLCRAALSLILLWGILSHPICLAAGHDQPGHCCDLCHSQHLPLVQAIPVFRLPHPVATTCSLALVEAPLPGEPDLVATSSRSPPAR